MFGEEMKYMSECQRHGQNGDCGVECPLFVDGGCPEPEEVFATVYPRPPRCADARLRTGTWYAVQRRSDGQLLDVEGTWKDPSVDLEGTLCATEDAARVRSERAGREQVQIVSLEVFFC
jgi:hypothetical protein